MVEDLIDLQNLKSISKRFWKKLRFQSSNLSVYTENGWRGLDELEAIEQSPEGEKIPIILENILLDTGNELDFCIMAIEFLKPFNKIFFNKHLKFTERLIGTLKDKKVLVRASQKALKFKLFDTRFISRIGFVDNINRQFKTTINIGIYCINQFLNVLFFGPEIYYYFCSNITNEDLND